MEYLILILKGMIIGVANIIPGVSGGTLMIILGLYEEIISTISHFFRDFKKSLKLVIPLGIGMILSILILSKLISVCLKDYPFPTTLFFIGLILGGLPLLWNKSKAAKETSWLDIITYFGEEDIILSGLFSLSKFILLSILFPNKISL